jgi:hypothetical protein
MDNPFVKLVITLLAYTIGVAIANGIVMWVYNSIMPELFGFKPIGYWQMFGLYIIGSYLFKSHKYNKKDSE